MLTNRRKVALSVRTKEGIQLLQVNLEGSATLHFLPKFSFFQSYRIKETKGKPFKANSYNI